MTSPVTTSNAITRPLPSATYISPFATIAVATQRLLSRIVYAQTGRRARTVSRLISVSGLNAVTSYVRRELIQSPGSRSSSRAPESGRHAAPPDGACADAAPIAAKTPTAAAALPPPPRICPPSGSLPDRRARDHRRLHRQRFEVARAVAPEPL